MGLDALLAGIGGGAGGVYNAQKFYQADDTKRQLAELKDMLSKVQESGRNSRNDENVQSREKLAAEARGQKDKDRDLKATQVSNDMTKFWDTSGRAWDQGQQRIDTTQRGQDMTSATAQRGQDQTDARGWATNERQWSLGQQGIDTTQRGQNISAATAGQRDATARRGQDLGADTSRANAATSAGTADANRRARVAIDIAKLKRQEAGNITSDPENPTDWADDFDKNYNNPALAASSAVAAAQRAGAAPAPAPAAAPAGPLAPPPGPPPAAAPGPVAAPAAKPSGMQIGQVVKVKGRAMTITAVYPDGTFDAK